MSVDKRIILGVVFAQTDRELFYGNKKSLYFGYLPVLSLFDMEPMSAVYPTRMAQYNLNVTMTLTHDFPYHTHGVTCRFGDYEHDV